MESNAMFHLWNGYLAFIGYTADKHEPTVWGDLLVYMWKKGRPNKNPMDFIEEFHTWLIQRKDNFDAVEKLYQALYKVRLGTI